ncbi:MAG: hypothetical protein H7A49_07235 [Akkermansiaceae bacterium]|nr:hypothetical protein [Akkermansiaceae bacterium]
MKTKVACRLAIAAGLAWLPVPTLRAGLVNGSFESGLDGWESGGNVTVESGSPYAPTDGSSLVAFNAMNLPPNGWIRQNAAVVAGRDHLLAFDIGNLGYAYAPQRIRIRVTEETPGGTSALIDKTLDLPGTTGGATLWSPLQGLGFTPTTEAVTVRFDDVSASTTGLDLVLDNVRLFKQLTHVEVTTDLDEDDGALGLGTGNSLREVLQYVSTHPEVDEIRFSIARDRYDILLEHGELRVETPVIIDAAGSGVAVTLDAGGNSRVMRISCDGEAQLLGVTLRGGAAADDGGGLRIDSGPEQTAFPDVTMRDCVVEDCGSAGSGGGVAVLVGNLDCESTRILRNRAAGNGGGTTSFLDIVGFDGCEFSENRAGGDGGAVFALLSKLTLDRSTLSSNRACGAGGAIHSHAAGAPYKSGYLISSNSTFTGNRSLDPGQAVYSFGVCSFVHCTMVANGEDPGTIHSAEGSVHLLNSIVATTGGDAVTGNTPILEGVNWLSGDPMLAPLADYGGGTPTRPPLPGSPVIDAASAEPGIPPTDQRNAPRPSGPLPDIGAVEAFPFSQLAPWDADGDGVDDRIEPAYGLTVGVDDSQADGDHDGSTDAEELANMTDPRDPSSRLRILSITPVEPFDPSTHPEFDIRFPSFPGLRYSVECDANAAFLPGTCREWSLGTATGPETSARVLLEPEHDFVRVRRDP